MHKTPEKPEPSGEFITIKPSEKSAFILRPSDVLWIWVYEGPVGS
jgi:hypothetical protein